MPNKMNPGKINVIILMCLIVLFCIFIGVFEKIQYKMDKAEVQKHTAVLGDAIWNLDPQSPVEYLKIAAQHNDYETVKVLILKEKEIFISINGPKKNIFHQTMVKIGLIPRLHIDADIDYKGKKTGVLKVVHLHNTVYLYFYVFLVLGLIWLAARFFVFTIHAKHTLEDKVQERTKELKHVQNLLSNIVNSMPSMLVGVDADNRIIQWNKATEKTTGVGAMDAQGKNLCDVFPRMESQLKKITQSINSRKTNYDPKQAVKSDSGTIYEDVTIYPLMTNGVEGAVIRIDDVTEKVMLEEMMVQSEKMLSVGGLAAGMAHEINNPLAGMLQSANVMENRLTQIDMPANLKAAKEAQVDMESIKTFMEERGILRMITTIRNSGERVAQIIDNMLSFARKSEHSVSSHDPAELLDKILELAATDYNLKKQYDFKTIKIIKEYEANLPMISCEGAKIQQVLLNILSNGAQAMQEYLKDDKDKKPEFILRLFKEAYANKLHIEIEDNGPGMDEETRKRIFEPFFTTKPVGQGTGLGLSVSYFIITENHDGFMDVISEPGNGATFIIRLPLE
jgi:PAS domain S-box-containing protein